jgi:solute carrier family 25 2-oxodicarboxylate transporter 21
MASPKHDSTIHKAHLPPLPFHKNVVAGGAAGIIEILCMYPTDIAKTRAQVAKESTSMLRTFKSILSESGPSGLYRGIWSPILAEAPKRAWKFSSNEKLKIWLTPTDGHVTTFLASMAGGLAGFSETIINCPFETVKVRMQDKSQLSKYLGTYDCLQKIIKEENITALYKGFEAQAWRNFIWNAIYFGTIGHIKKFYPERHDEKNPMLRKFLVGTLGSLLATIVNTPFDVVKSRMQAQQGHVNLKYRWAWPSLATIVQEEGIKAAYKGLGPRLIRLGPGGGIMLVAFETVSEWLR